MSTTNPPANFLHLWAEGQTLPLFRNWRIKGGIEINGKRWLERIQLKRRFDAVVYSANGELAANCRRLLTAKQWGTFPSTCEVRAASNVHTKLYLWCDEVWVGSRNLVDDASYHNVMVRVNYAQAESLRLYFERLWSLAKGEQ